MGAEEGRGVACGLQHSSAPFRSSAVPNSSSATCSEGLSPHIYKHNMQATRHHRGVAAAASLRACARSTSPRSSLDASKPRLVPRIASCRRALASAASTPLTRGSAPPGGRVADARARLGRAVAAAASRAGRGRERGALPAKGRPASGSGMQTIVFYSNAALKKQYIRVAVHSFSSRICIEQRRLVFISMGRTGRRTPIV